MITIIRSVRWRRTLARRPCILEKSDKMQEKRYLLSVKELLLDEELFHRACEKLDAERLKRVQKIKSKESKAQSVGAGLMLQYIVQKPARANESEEGRECLDVEVCTIKDMLEQLQSPVEIAYTYGRLGKPYFKNLSLYFSLSHSGEYVFCAVSDREIGADIQINRPLKNNNLEKRYFTEQERALLESKCDKEREALFYQLWTKKEAYGKLTGDGIGEAVGLDTEELSERVVWEQYPVPDGYCIAVCRYRLENIGEVL